MVLVQPFHAFSVPTLLLFPLVSLAMNNLGHMNYDLSPRARPTGTRWPRPGATSATTAR